MSKFTIDHSLLNAAAPDLYAAARVAEVELGHWAHVEGVEASLKLVRDAIAKAEGRAVAVSSLYEAARAALDVIPVGEQKDALVEALLKAEGRDE